MSKVFAAALACLIVLPLIASPALAQKNTGARPNTGSSTMANSGCTTSSVPKWQCPPGKSPGDFACTIIMVDQRVCHVD